MKIVYIAVSHPLGNFIHLKVSVIQQLFCFGDTHLVQVRIKIDVQLFGKQPSQIGAVIAKQRSQCLKLQILLIIMPDIMQDFIQYIFPGGVSNGMHPHLKLFF